MLGPRGVGGELRVASDLGCWEYLAQCRELAVVAYGQHKVTVGAPHQFVGRRKQYVIPGRTTPNCYAASGWTASSTCQVRARTRVPCSNSLPFARLLSPRLTTVRQPAYDMGHRAATLVLDLLDGKADVQPTGLFPVTLKVRDSVAPPKAARR